MTIEITGPPETPASCLPDPLQQKGVQTKNQASVKPVLITKAELALGTAAAPGVRRKERRWVALLGRSFAAAKESRSTRRPYRRSTTYLDRARMAREMKRL